MRYAIIGAGISGLAIAQMLKKKNEVTIFESENRPGGMIKCDRVEGSLFHRTGGHVFNTKRDDVMHWFWNHFDRESEFKETFRNAAVCTKDGKYIPYPIENHSYLFDEATQKSIIYDWLEISKESEYVANNFADFLYHRFGKTLYNIYFEPYNEKVWRRDLSNIPLDWLSGKLPMPTVNEMIFYNMNHVEERKFVHSSFFYPNENGSQFLANRLSEGLNIFYNSKIDTIDYNSRVWSVNGKKFDRIIFCGNIKQIPSLIPSIIDISGYADDIEKLEYHGTTAVFCEINKNPYSWLYMPSKSHLSHRIICTGNFSTANNSAGKMTATIEFTDEISKDDVLDNISRMPLNPKYLTHHYEKCTYPIQDKCTREMIRSITDKLSEHGFYLLGRLAQWEYSNMDVCIGAAIDLKKTLDT